MADLKTTFTPDRSKVTSTPGASAPAYPGLSPDVLAALLQRQPAAARQDAPSMLGRPSSGYGGGGVGGYEPAYQPQMAAQASTKPKEIVRMRPVPQNPYDAMARIPGGLGGTGNTNTVQRERWIPGVGWEFDGIDSMNPRGSSGGIIGGGDPSISAHIPAAFDPRMMALIAQQERASAGSYADLPSQAAPAKRGGR